MSISSFAFAGTSGSVVNDVRGLVQTGGFKRYSDIVQTGMAVVQFKNFYFAEMKPYEDEGDAISMPKMAIIMEGKVKQIDGEFPNGINSVQFSEDQEPKCTYAYQIDTQEQAYMSGDLGGRFGIRNHLIEEPYQLPIQYTVDYFEGRDKSGQPLTILNVNLVQAHNTDMNAISRKALGESLIVAECYAKPLEREMETELGEFYRNEEELQRLEQADKEEAAKKPIESPQAVAALSPEEVALNAQSVRVGEYVAGVLSEQDARRKQHELEEEEKRKKEQAAEMINEAEQPEPEQSVAKSETVSKPVSSGRFDKNKLNALLGITDTDAPDGPNDTPDFGE